MSGIYISGMEMPTSCFYCPFRRKVDPDDIMCIVTREVFEETFAGTIETRNRGNCPLVPVPEHGRLIDADALDIYRREEQAWHDYEQNSDNEYLEGVKDGLHEAAKQLSTAPTIIPAEEGE